MRFVILASGNGSNAEALINKAKDMADKCQCVGVVSDKENPGVKARANSKEIPFYSVPVLSDKASQELQLFELLKKLEVDWVLLAGYMKILSNDFLSKLSRFHGGESRVLNIHPSLLPKFRGKNAYEQAFSSTESTSGVTVHFVDDGVDTGKIIVQKEFQKLESDNFSAFQKRGLQLEHKLYPEVLEMLVRGQVSAPKFERKQNENL